MWFTKSLKGAVAVLPLLLIALVWAGCGENVITPDQPLYTADNPPPFLTGSGSAGVMNTASGEWYQIAAAKVLPDERKTLGGGRYEFTFEAGAVSEPTEITIREYDSHVLDAQFGPHGIQFGASVMLEVDYSGTNADPESKNYDGSVPVFFWFNEKTGVWDEMKGYVSVEKKVYVVRLEHFSRYALGGRIPGDGTADW